MTFRPMSWRPFYGAFKGQSCGGVQVHLTDPGRAELTRINFEVMDALRKVAPARRLFAVPAEESRMFDLVCGTDNVRKSFEAGKSSAEIWRQWNSDSQRFRERRKRYLLYD